MSRQQSKRFRGGRQGVTRRANEALRRLIRELTKKTKNDKKE